MNLLSGNLPAEGQALPSSLRALFLDRNQLQGTLGANLTLPAGLVNMSLQGNLGLTGALPLGWELPPSLAFLYLNNCSLSGGLPQETWPHAALRQLSLADNQLSGQWEGAARHSTA